MASVCSGTSLSLAFLIPVPRLLTEFGHLGEEGDQRWMWEQVLLLKPGKICRVRTCKWGGQDSSVRCCPQLKG